MATGTAWRAWISYGLITLAVIGGLALLLGTAFRGSGDKEAIWLSAGLAAGVQIVVFPVVRSLVGVGNLMMGWGVGALVRFLTLAAFGVLVVLHVVAVAPLAALIGMATFLFASTLVEPFFLRR